MPLVLEFGCACMHIMWLTKADKTHVHMTWNTNTLNDKVLIHDTLTQVATKLGAKAGSKLQLRGTQITRL
jgi:hypothetical protein